MNRPTPGSPARAESECADGVGAQDEESGAVRNRGDRDCNAAWGRPPWPLQAHGTAPVRRGLAEGRVCGDGNRSGGADGHPKEAQRDVNGTSR